MQYRRLRNFAYRSTEPDRLLTFVKSVAKEGDIPSILAACDKYCVEKEWIMHLGGEKGKVFCDIVSKIKPKMCLELGTYSGYSAILLASLLPEDGKVYTVEFDSNYAQAARLLIQYAKMDHKITILCGDAGEVIPTLRNRYSLDKFDFVFIDHHKPFYCRDLKLIEKNNHLRKGTVIIADDLGWPGAPEYDEYVQTSKRYKSSFYNTKTVFLNILDVMGKSIYLSDD
ncbi:putative catechol O-methyltransferase-like isoform X2 [Apostichopus japonicus]|uniref:catechol O-methyltransferase n=2 Tax=Stichopus japonicus TaxID=307972 RepID=A0A2G8JSL0_STIJA|nr:putative catechol O-methyltransferase-like isoform X2 [Apostichopus japonicus]